MNISIMHKFMNNKFYRADTATQTNINIHTNMQKSKLENINIIV